MLNEEEMPDAVLLASANNQNLPSAMTVAEVTEKLGVHSMWNRQWVTQSACFTMSDRLLKGLDWLSRTLAAKNVESRVTSLPLSGSLGVPSEAALAQRPAHGARSAWPTYRQMHSCGIRRLMYQLASAEVASCLQVLVYGWHEYQSDMKLTRSAEQPAALRRQLHGWHAHVREKAFLRRHGSDSTSRLHQSCCTGLTRLTGRTMWTSWQRSSMLGRSTVARWRERRRERTVSKRSLDSAR